jgi:hypothetical protein
MSDRTIWIMFLPIFALVVATIIDLVLRRDVKLGTKILWGLVIILLPGLGSVIYLLARYKVFSTVRKSMS